MILLLGGSWFSLCILLMLMLELDTPRPKSWRDFAEAIFLGLQIAVLIPTYGPWLLFSKYILRRPLKPQAWWTRR